jgi:hypothetical protein
MQLLTQPRRKLPEFAEPQSAQRAPVPVFEAKAEKQPAHLKTFRFAQTIIPFEGGTQCLRLLKPLTLKIGEALRFKVQDWGIELDCADLPKLPREIARRFLFLLTAAENEQLNEVDQADWLRISDYVDFRQFTIDRSPPRYQEGTLLRNDVSIVVEWHDGTRETLDSRTARSLSDVNVGERFAAHVKLGKDDRSMSIERVSLLGVKTNPAHEDWTNWPAKN